MTSHYTLVRIQTPFCDIKSLTWAALIISLTSILTTLPLSHYIPCTVAWSCLETLRLVIPSSWKTFILPHYTTHSSLEFQLVHHVTSPENSSWSPSLKKPLRDYLSSYLILFPLEHSLVSNIIQLHCCLTCTFFVFLYKNVCSLRKMSYLLWAIAWPGIVTQWVKERANYWVYLNSLARRKLRKDSRVSVYYNQLRVHEFSFTCFHSCFNFIRALHSFSFY